MEEGKKNQPPVSHRHDFRGRGGLRLAAEITGDGPPVLLLHGGGQTRGSWKDTATILAGKGYRAIALDARGHGESQWAKEGYRFEYFADDLLEILKDIDGRPALVGASLGGLTSILAIGESTQPIASALVLVDIAPTLNRRGMKEIATFMRANPDGFASVEEAADSVSRYMTDRPRPRDISGLRRNLRERDGRFYWHWDPAFMTPQGENNQFDTGSLEERMKRAARHVAVPTLLVRGMRSHIVSEQEVEDLQSTIPHCEIAEVAKAGHMVAGDANTGFADALIPWLTRNYPPA